MIPSGSRFIDMAREVETAEAEEAERAVKTVAAEKPKKKKP